MTYIRRLKPDELVSELQVRVKNDSAVVDEYAAMYGENTDAMPPVIVYQDGKRFWLADGVHRVLAARKARVEAIRCDLRKGTRRDALLYAVGANAAHGLRRTNEDKRRAVELLLGDREWSGKSNRWIAKACAVSLDLVNRIRAESTERDVQLNVSPRVGLDGKKRRPRRSSSRRMRGEEPVQAAPTKELSFDTTAATTRVTEVIADILASWPEGEPLAALITVLEQCLDRVKVNERGAIGRQVIERVAEA